MTKDFSSWSGEVFGIAEYEFHNFRSAEDTKEGLYGGGVGKDMGVASPPLSDEAL